MKRYFEEQLFDELFADGDCCMWLRPVWVVYCKSGSYFHLYDGLQGLGFAWILMQLVSSVQFLSEKIQPYVAPVQRNLL